MANTSVLDPFSTKPREAVKVNPRNQVGGPMEYVEGVLDLIFKGPQGPLVNEDHTPTPESFEAREPVTTSVPEVYKNAFSSGSIENFQQPDPQKVIEAALVQNYQQKQEVTLEDMARYGLAGATKQELATEGNYQPNYEGESVESKYNFAWVFLKRVVKAIKESVQSSFKPFEILSNRKSSKGAVSGVTTDMLLRADEHEGRSATSSSGGMTHGG